MKHALYLIFSLLLNYQLSAQKLDWVQKFGGTGNDIAWKVASDKDENYYVLGEFSTTLPLDSLGSARNLTSEGGRDIYLAKYNCSRVLLWRLRVGGVLDDGGEFPFMGLKVMPNGDIYFSGSFSGSVNFYDASLVKFTTRNSMGASDYFLAKVNANGFYAWAVSGGGLQNDENTSLEVDASGNVYCTGFFTGTASFGSFALAPITKTSAGSSDIFIAKYNSLGIIQAVATAGGARQDVPNHVALDEFGNLYVAGNYSCCSGGAAFFGSLSVSNISGWGAFVAKLVISGTTVNWVWLNHIGGFGNDGFSKVMVDKTNQAVYVVGHSNLAANAVLSSQAPGSSFPLTNTGGYDIVAARFDYNGAMVWAKTFGGTGDDFGYSMAIDKASNVLIAGSFSNTITLGSQNLVATAAGSGYIASLNPTTGNPNSAIKLSGTSGNVTVMDLEVSDRNYLYASGYFTGNLQVNSTTILVNGALDGFVAGIALKDSLTLTANKLIFNCGDSIRLTAQSFGATLFNWFRNDTLFKQTTSNIIFTAIPGIYKVVALKKCAAADTSTLVVLTMQDLVSNISSPIMACFGDSVSVSVNSNANNFSWIPANLFNHPNQKNVKAFADTTRYLYVLLQLGSCIKRDSVLLTVKRPIITILPSPAICKGDTIQLFAVGASQYTWWSKHPLSDSLIASPKVWPQQDATYYVRSVVDNCPATDSINLSVTNIQSHLASDTLICLGDSIALNIGFNYSNVQWWPNYHISNTTFHSPKVWPTIDTSYMVSIIQNGCTLKDTIFVKVVSWPNLNVGNDVALCQGSSVKLNAQGANKYAWFPNLAISDTTISNPVISPNQSITYYVFGSVGNCYVLDSIQVLVTPISVNAGPDLFICPGDTAQIAAQSSTVDLFWTPNVAISNPFELSPKAWPSTSTTYYLKVTNDNCSLIDTMQVIIRELPKVDAGENIDICVGDTVTLQATGASSYLWLSNYAIQNNSVFNPRVFPTQDTNYVVRGTDQFCSNTDTIQIQVLAYPAVDAGENRFICPQETLPLKGEINNATSFLWRFDLSLSDPNILNPIAAPKQNTWYYLSGMNKHCIHTDSVEVSLFPPIVSAFSATPKAGFKPLIVVFTNNSSANASSFWWEFGDGNTDTAKNPSNLYVLKGKYKIYLVAKDTNNCSDTSHQEITVMEEEYLFIPNVFTPQSDKLNDVFEPVYATDQFPTLVLTIYSRWGELMWQTTMPGGTWWDGTFKGNDCPSDVYFYVLTASSISGKAYNLQGTVTLLR